MNEDRDRSFCRDSLSIRWASGVVICSGSCRTVIAWYAPAFLMDVVRFFFLWASSLGSCQDEVSEYLVWFCAHWVTVVLK